MTFLNGSRRPCAMSPMSMIFALSGHDHESWLMGHDSLMSHDSSHARSVHSHPLVHGLWLNRLQQTFENMSAVFVVCDLLDSVWKPQLSKWRCHKREQWEAMRCSMCCNYNDVFPNCWSLITILVPSWGHAGTCCGRFHTLTYFSFLGVCFSCIVADADVIECRYQTNAKTKIEAAQKHCATMWPNAYHLTLLAIHFSPSNHLHKTKEMQMVGACLRTIPIVQHRIASARNFTSHARTKRNKSHVTRSIELCIQRI